VGVPFKKARQLWYAAKEYLEREEGLTDENFEERKQAFIDEHGPIGVVKGASEEE